MTCGIEAWLYHSLDRDTKLRSSSGGAFYELAKNALAEGYFLCGCVWDNNLVARHIVSRDINDLQRMQGSKYVQSCTGKAQRELIRLLKSGKKVLFSGTPCQVIAASKIASILNKRDNLEKAPEKTEQYKIFQRYFSRILSAMSAMNSEFVGFPFPVLIVYPNMSSRVSILPRFHATSIA